MANTCDHNTANPGWNAVPSSQRSAGKIASVRARPVVTLAIEAGFATANHVHM